jgi:hypothetical protein
VQTGAAVGPGLGALVYAGLYAALRRSARSDRVAGAVRGADMAVVVGMAL